MAIEPADSGAARPSMEQVILGYLGGCLAAALAFGLMVLVSGANASVGAGEALSVSLLWIGFTFAAFVLTAWPGFALLRLIMFGLGRHGLISFVIAGALNATFTKAFAEIAMGQNTIAGLLQRPPHPLTLTMGAVAGLTAWFIEKGARSGRRT
jgi:hypothetical protein